MGRRKKTDLSHSSVPSYICCRCGEEWKERSFYASTHSIFNSGKFKIPYCKNCLKDIYEYYCDKYKKEDAKCFYEKKAIKRICMACDIFFSEEVFDSALKNTERSPNMPLLSSYFKVASLQQSLRKTYDDTLAVERDLLKKELFEERKMIEEEEKNDEAKMKLIKFWGLGFSDSDYDFLQNEYQDWVTRHECNTKAQEEVFKQICYTQLELQKAVMTGADSKDLRATFQKLLDTANLQPKQNKKDTISDAQTFGTLIDKWENTRPIPEVDPELKDVDKIGLLIDVFFKGHLAKMMGLKNGLSNLYEKYIKKYTVQKPEYDSEEDSEVLFDSIFGSPENMED